MQVLDKSLLAEQWQLFITSQLWSKFLSEKLYGESGYITSEEKVKANALKNADTNRAIYTQGVCDGVSMVVKLMSSYHTDLTREVS